MVKISVTSSLRGGVGRFQCDACPFRLLRDLSETTKPCANCRGVTDASLARFRAIAQWHARLEAGSEPQGAEEAVNDFALSCALKGFADRYDPERGSEERFVAGLFHSWRRSARRRRKRPVEMPESFDAADSEPDPADCASAGEIREIVRSALAQLPPRYRVALCVEYGISDPRDPAGGVPTPYEPCNPVVLFRARRSLRRALLAIGAEAESMF